MAVGAHLDDIELGCGGTLATLARGGADVHMIVLSPSQYARYDGTVLRTVEEARTEGSEAARRLGVSHLDVLDFPTKDIPYDSTTVEALESRFDRLTPELIITHWPQDTHQAHRAVAMSTISAARHHPSILMFEPIFPSGRSYAAFRAQMYVDITQTVSAKEEALKAHRSQFEKYGQDWLDAVRARSAVRGYEIGVRHAEAFEIVRCQLEL